MNIHEYQRAILAKLVIKQPLRFNELLVDGIESEHVNYHLKKLIETQLVTKSGTTYTLTDKGKDLMNLYNDTFTAVEKQPKTGVILNIVRFNKEKNAIENLLNRRQRQPYYGKVGRAGGKVSFGETLEQAAKRELLEETGLTIESLALEKIYHKVRFREDQTVVQDVIFYIFFGADPVGEIKNGPFEDVFWATEEEAKDLDVYDDFEFSQRLKPNPLSFEEHMDVAEGY